MTLTLDDRFDGAMGFGDAFALPGPELGTVTWVPEVESLLEPGDALFRVDERPTYWASGTVPMYRTLRRGAEGSDVRQLQGFLRIGGYLDADALLDGEFGPVTEQAVEEWQSDHGLDDTGVIGPSQLLFLPYESLRVDAVDRLGDAADGSVITVTEDHLTVTVDVGESGQAVFEDASTIDVELADGSQYPAHVETIRPQVSTDQNGDQEFLVSLRVETDRLLPPGEVAVEVASTVSEDVLTVPVAALVALAEGGYAVEVASEDGTSEYRAVELGAFAQGRVQVDGQVEEGDRVVVPR